MAKLLNFQIDEYYLDLQQRAQGMDILEAEDTKRNPYPGLRPFRTAEAHLFFGREGQSEELISRLMETHFLGVLGNSGSGKSSLVRAGLIPALHAGSRQPSVYDWKIAICRPGNSPLQNLAAALAGAGSRYHDISEITPRVNELLPVLRESSFGLLEADQADTTHQKTILIVDQFEELFRFERDIPGGDAAHFVDLLITAVQQKESHIYVVITMRSEFLGECVQYRGLPEIINQGQYLVPRLSHENLRRAIAGPLGVVNAPVEGALVNRLLRDLGENMDQLPLLQHALMRTYHGWQARGEATPIGHDDYDSTGGIREAIGRHADEQYARLDEKGKDIAKVIFQRLTDLSTGDKGGRRPTRLEEIYGIAAALPASEAEVNAVIEHFRDKDTSFLMPPPGPPLQKEQMLDIAHESLIRNWTRLHEWANQETENARLYKRLQQALEEHHSDPSQVLISGALLQRLREWRVDSKLNGYWASRYHPAAVGLYDWDKHSQLFNDHNGYLEHCVQAEEEAGIRKAREQARKLEEAESQAAKERELREKAERAMSEAAAERDKAKAALAKLEDSNRQVVKLLLNNLEKDILALKYEEAFETAISAASLNVEKPEVAAAVLELAFWFGETGYKARADTLMRTAYQLLEKSYPDTRDMHQALRALDKGTFDKVMKRYYPLDTVFIAGGSFEMGCKPGRDDVYYSCKDNETLHPRRVADFLMLRHEVTWWQYRLFCAATDREFEPPGWGTQGDNPVVNVSWHDAVAYTQWLNARLGYAAGKGYRLPSEAEWEYAARGGEESAFAGCNSEGVLEEYAWYNINSKSRTQTVKTKKPNGYGLYDMSGNVYEWCEDDYHEDYKAGPVDGRAWVDDPRGSDRVLRGGSWGGYPVGCRVAYRDGGGPEARDDDIGFRLVFVP